MPKRMFNKAIVQTDVFLDMPLTTQALYFHLSMHADDYGFVSPKYVMRIIGANDDDLKLLIAKRYLLTFESGVVVIKHWQVNNTIRKDRSHPTTYKTELDSLIFNEFGAYTERRTIIKTIEAVENATTKNRDKINNISNRQPNGNQMATENRIEENRIDKTSISTNVDISAKPNASHISALLRTLMNELGHSENTLLTDSRKKKLKQRLKFFTEEQLIQAAKNIYNNGFLQGDNPGGRKYGTIDYLLRSDEKLEEQLNGIESKVNYEADW